MIVATAGHVDHGKTLLVKALTGVDTDRLPEEKRRNLTIDLGFAYLRLADGKTIGFVDVPGHERFVRNMLCGVASIDFVLFIVAADDGPKPQTREHLAILDLLGVSRGAVALTKIDRVDAARTAEVTAEIGALFAATSLAAAPVFPVSAITGDGVEALKAHLAFVAGEIAARDRSGNFRLAVDRSFNIVGAGVVVTGTVFSGTAAVGEQLVVSPGNLPVRVRGIHAQDREAQAGVAGDRCALNIAGPGLRRASVRRGDWIVAPPAHRPTRKIDARIRVLADEVRPLAHWTPVHVHLGAENVTGRLAVLEGGAIAPGETALVQLVLDQAIGALHGDRLILRDQSARRTVGGGEVIDIFPPPRGRAKPARLAHLRAMANSDPKQALADVLDGAENGLDLERFRCNRNLTADEAAVLWAEATMTVVGTGAEALGFAPRHWQGLRTEVLAALAGWHRSHPDSLGATAQNLASLLERRLPPEVLAWALPALGREGALVHDGTRVRLARHAPKLAPPDQALWRQIEPLLEEGGLRPMRVREIADEIGADLRRVETFLGRAARIGLVVQVSKNRFFTPAILLRLAVIAEQVAAEAADGRIAATGFRDRAGVGRNLAIEILEYFDKAKFTRRIGDGRALLRPAAEIFGAPEGS